MSSTAVTRRGKKGTARPTSGRVGLKLTVVVVLTLLSAFAFAASHATAAGSAADAVPASAIGGDQTPFQKPQLVSAPSSPPAVESTLVPTTAPATHPAIPAQPKVVPTVIRAPRPASTPAAVVPIPVISTSPGSTGSYGCGAALSYLSTHAAPGFRFECPGYALGHQAMTCVNVAGVCPGSHLIVISDPCSAAYMNEASNSWVLEGLRQAPIDPYGYCH
jgi:hypothetical protein